MAKEPPVEVVKRLMIVSGVAGQGRFWKMHQIGVFLFGLLDLTANSPRILGNVG